MKIHKFEELQIWQDAIGITKLIYDVSATSKFSRDFGLRDQIRRAVVSITSNIVEGFEKNNNNEFIRFLRIAKGSAGEVRNQLHIALSVSYITQEEFDTLAAQLEKLSNQMGAFISYLSNKRAEGQFLPTR